MACLNPLRLGTLLPFVGRLRFPQLFVLLATLFALDLVVPDFVPLFDEAVLGLLTLMTGLWKDRRPPDEKPAEKPPEKNVTPPEARG